MTTVLNRGVFVLSIDLELGGPGQVSGSIEAIEKLLPLLEEYDIRATWATMGNMLNDEKGTSSIIKKIQQCKVKQEIGCHTYSHLRATDVSVEQFQQDLRECDNLFHKAGITPRSFVFPWNAIKNIESLNELGYLAFRGDIPRWFSSSPQVFKRVAYLIDHWLPFTPHIPKLYKESGVWNLPASYFYVEGSGWGDFIPLTLRIRKVERGLQLAIKTKGMFHLWFHPFNLASNTEKWIRGLEQVFSKVSKYREISLMDNYSMGELAVILETNTEAS